MSLHRNAELGLAGRRALVSAIESGLTLKAAAAAFSVSPATAHRWWQRWREAGIEARRSWSCLRDRSSRPHRSPRRLAPECERAICECRRKTGWGPRLIAGATGFRHSTVWKVLKRAGISRPPRPRREPANRYEWPCPGDLLHLDVSEYVRFKRPGHRVTGDRSSQDRSPDGIEYVHAIVDDHSRLAYAEIHDDARSDTAAGFLERALAFYTEHGISVRRVMTDNAWAYTKARTVRELLRSNGIRHLTTKPYRPRTNGKVERFHQTMAREWAYGVVYTSSQHRRRALPHWLHHYNRGRPHSSLGDRPPISRVHNVCG
jgi:transposase InsO family protein